MSLPHKAAKWCVMTNRLKPQVIQRTIKNGSRKSPGIHYNLLVSDEMSAIFYQSATSVNGLEKGLIADTTTT